MAGFLSKALSACAGHGLLVDESLLSLSSLCRERETHNSVIGHGNRHLRRVTQRCQQRAPRSGHPEVPALQGTAPT